MIGLPLLNRIEYVDLGRRIDGLSQTFHMHDMLHAGNTENSVDNDTVKSIRSFWLHNGFVTPSTTSYSRLSARVAIANRLTRQRYRDQEDVCSCFISSGFALTCYSFSGYLFTPRPVVLPSPTQLWSDWSCLVRCAISRVKPKAAMIPAITSGIRIF